MADILTTELVASIRWLWQDQYDLSTATDSSKVEYAVNLADGVGANEADTIWHDTRDLGASSAETLNLIDISRVVFGATATFGFAVVKALLIVNTAKGSGETLTVGGAASTPFVGPFGDASDTIDIGADCALLIADKVDGWTTSTANNLKIQNNGSSTMTYKIVVVGATS